MIATISKIMSWAVTLLGYFAAHAGADTGARPRLGSADLPLHAKDRMTESEAEEIWAEYYERIKNRRLGEAGILWPHVVSKVGADEPNLLVLT